MWNSRCVSVDRSQRDFLVEGWREWRPILRIFVCFLRTDIFQLTWFSPESRVNWETWRSIRWKCVAERRKTSHFNRLFRDHVSYFRTVAWNVSSHSSREKLQIISFGNLSLNRGNVTDTGEESRVSVEAFRGHKKLKINSFELRFLFPCERLMRWAFVELRQAPLVLFPTSKLKSHVRSAACPSRLCPTFLTFGECALGKTPNEKIKFKIILVHANEKNCAARAMI